MIIVYIPLICIIDNSQILVSYHISSIFRRPNFLEISKINESTMDYCHVPVRS